MSDKVGLAVRCFVIGPRGLLLVIKRSAHSSHRPGQWEVPGGKASEGKDLWEALEREVLEETGLRVKPMGSSFTVAEIETVEGGRNAGLSYVTLFCVTDLVGGELILSGEHESFEWVTFDEFKHFGLTPETRRAADALKSLLS